MADASGSEIRDNIFCFMGKEKFNYYISSPIKKKEPFEMANASGSALQLLHILTNTKRAFSMTSKQEIHPMTIANFKHRILLALMEES